MNHSQLGNHHQNKHNFAYAGTFLLAIGFLLILAGFWYSEVIFWNRTPYKIVQWQNSNPDFAQQSLATIKMLLSQNLHTIVLGLIFFLVGLTLIGYYGYSYSKLESKTLGYLTFILSLLVAIGFWLYNSLNISVNHTEYVFTSASESLKTPTLWMSTFVPGLKQQFDFVSLFMMFVFFLLFSALMGYLFIFRYLKSKKSQRLESFTEIKTSWIQMIGFYMVMIIYLIITLVPVLLTVIVSISAPVDLRNYQKLDNQDLTIAPSNAIASLIMNYSTVLFVTDHFTGSSFTSAFFISLILGFGTASIGLIMSLTSAYALSRFQFRSRGKLIFSLVVIQMFPGIILLIPQYIIWNSLGLLQKDVKLIGVLLAISVGAIGYSTWMMKGYFDTLPKDLEEASLIDGAGVFETFLRIAIPLAKPGMVAVFLFSFLGAWNDFLLVRIFIGEKQADSTLSLLFYNYQDLSKLDAPIFFELVGAYSIIMSIPIAIIFMALQKYLATGATAGAIK